MTDKEKIREAVEKRYEYWREKEFNSHSTESEIRMSECQHLLLMLNSLQEEPVSEELEKEIRRYRMNNPIIGHREESLYDYITNVAKHFFGLGLKAQKGE